ncbi:hypothetical protein LP420_18720 [Massilia sp. B-10]|nr:hypothetical protein LP420_18720 [Massilia sp. B-10]
MPKLRLRSQAGVACRRIRPVRDDLFTFVFGVIELARAVRLQHDGRGDAARGARRRLRRFQQRLAALAGVRRVAMFGDVPGGMPLLRGNLREEQLAIDYLNGALERVNPMLRACPEQNIINCNQDPDGASCIRFVRVRLCSEGGGADCSWVPYEPIVSANFFPGAPLHFPTFATVTPVATLGHQPGVAGNCL